MKKLCHSDFTKYIPHAGWQTVKTITQSCLSCSCFLYELWKLNSPVPVTQSQTIQIKMDSLKAMSNDNASSSI